MPCRERAARKAAKLQSEIDKKAKKAKARQARVEAKAAEAQQRLEGRGFQQLLTQKGKADKAIDSGKACTYIVPSDQVPNKATGEIPVTRVRQKGPTLKLGGKKAKKALKLADSARQLDCWMRCSVCNIPRQLLPGTIRPSQADDFDCSMVGKHCGVADAAN